MNDVDIPHRKNAAEWAMSVVWWPLMRMARAVATARESFNGRQHMSEPRPTEPASPDASSASTSSSAPLDYGHGSRKGDWLRRSLADFDERVDGVAVFIGMLLGILLGLGRLGLGAGLACLAGGIGATLIAVTRIDPSYAGPTWMAAGAFLVGIYWPRKGN